MTGIELDPVSAAIAAALYPHAQVHAESFAETRRPSGYFDAVVGNVPFAEVRLHDPVHNRGGHTMHNHFLVKSLALTRPGGLVVALTSRFTLDQVNPGARREMNAMADLVGAVRLPAGAHRRAAGTDVVTDLVVLRRREEDARVRDEVWETVGAHLVDGYTVRTNNYFLDHPEDVLGTYRVGHGMYGEETLSVDGDVDALPATLERVLGEVVDRARTQDLTWAPATAAEVPKVAARVARAEEGLWEGHITATEDGSFTILVEGLHEPLAVPGTRAGELRALLALRDGARDLLALESASLEDTEDLAAARRALHARYSAYVARYGPVNRSTTRGTGKVDPETGEQRLARVRPPVMNTFRKDPFNALVMALESYDDATGSATPAQLLSQRVVVPRTPVLGVDDPSEALAVSVEALGRADLDHIASLLGVDATEARAQLATLVYDDPGQDGRIIPAAEYLSGNVLDKLDEARAAAERDPRYTQNVRALTEVVPTPLGVDEISARLGAAWLNADTHTAFAQEVLRDPTARVIHAGGAMWEVKARSHTIEATSEWGTARMAAPAILKAVLEQRQVQVTDPLEDGSRVLNPTETEAAREKAGALQERFAEWVWEDPERAERLAGVYNRTFNALVLRDYTTEGQRLTLPGLVRTFTPREHQRTAVARMIAEPAVGLFHEVGAGKTAEMAMGVMELRRLGLVNKPALNVPNHMLEQFTREWLQLYPNARLLAASGEDLAGDGRRRFVARAATGDWDAIIMTRGAFERIPVSRATEAAYMDTEMRSVRAMLGRLADERGSSSVKRLEKRVAAIEERVRAKLDSPQDPGITFEETGIDYVVVDEMHDFKNLLTVSNIPDAAIAGSQRASDLHMKLEYLRSRHGERVVTGATATPIANSVTEAHVMQRFMRPDLLRAAGVEEFDAWAATFGQVVTEIEMSVTGGYKQKSRFARFQNVPEMLRTWHTFADVKTAEDLNLDRPLIAMRPDGTRGPRTMILAPSDELVDYVAWLGKRAEDVANRVVDPSTDNMLKITTDGRKAALDLRLAGGDRTEDNKAEHAADRIHAIWQANRDRVYRDPVTGERAPVPGALQIVFCDLGTPSATWNVYEELRRQLVRRGVPREEVRFMHEAAKDADKARMFAAARAGHVSVLVGSTQKMGVGTNVQARAVALHHLDCPWRPADLEQRDGRILRQGNQNPEIEIYRWVTERSFDAYSWQTVERKAKFIAQVMRGRLDVREIEDIGDSALSFAEVKALASGNPLVMEREKAVQAVTKYERLERAFHRNQVHLSRGRQAASSALGAAESDLPAITAAAARAVPTAGDAFAMTVAGVRYTSRTDAATALRQWVNTNAGATVAHTFDTRPLGVVCDLAGHTITAEVAPRVGALILRAPGFMFQLDGVPRSQWRVDVEVAAGDGIGLVRQMENHVERLPALVERVQGEIDTARRDVEQAQNAQAKPFKHAGDLAAAREELQRIETILNPPEQKANDTVNPTTPAPNDETPHASTGQTPGWVFIERQHGPDVAVGPYASMQTAERALQDDPFIDALCEEDALGATTVTTPPVGASRLAARAAGLRTELEQRAATPPTHEGVRRLLPRMQR